jgi:hypothetical protein
MAEIPSTKKEKIKFLVRRYGEIIKDVKKCKEDIKIKRKCLFTIESALIKEKWGIEIGDLVTNRLGIEMKVVTIEAVNIFRNPCKEKPWVKASRRRKDGEFSTVVENLYDEWNLIEEEK